MRILMECYVMTITQDGRDGLWSWEIDHYRRGEGHTRVDGASGYATAAEADHEGRQAMCQLERELPADD